MNKEVVCDIDTNVVLYKGNRTMNVFIFVEMVCEAFEIEKKRLRKGLEVNLKKRNPNAHRKRYIMFLIMPFKMD